jgi:hypothetical protein
MCLQDEHTEALDLRILPIVLNSNKLDLFPSSGELRETPTLLGPLERANLITGQPMSRNSNYINTYFVLVFLVVSLLPAFSLFYMRPSSPHSCYMPRLSHPPRLDYSNYIWRRVEITKLPVMQFSPLSRHSIPLRSKYPPQHPVLKHPQSVFLP